QEFVEELLVRLSVPRGVPGGIGKIMKKQHLRVLMATLALAAVTVALLEAKTKKGDEFFKQGQAAEAKGDLDGALNLYKKAVEESPSDAGYLIAERKIAYQAGEKHVTEGQKLRDTGK